MQVSQKKIILMPSQRKRIGFLPREEVQSIIDQICKDNKLSQSKVTGILVEEALKTRGMLNTFLDNKKVNGNDNFYLEKGSINEEVQMIYDYIEFKFFKKIMNKSKKEF